MPVSTLSIFLKENIKASSDDQKTILDQALKLDGKAMEKQLLASGLVDDVALAKLKADYFHIPFITLDELNVQDKAIELIPASTIKTYRIVPFSKDKNQVKIALSDPTDLRMLEAVEFLAKKNSWDVQLYLLTDRDLNSLLQRTGTGVEVKEALQEFTESQVKVTEQARQRQADKEVKWEEKQAPVAKIIDSIITQALSQRASDVHIEPLQEESRVRFRIDGILRVVHTFPINAHNSLVSRIKIMSNLKIDEQRIPQDGRFHFRWNDDDVDFRVSTFPAAYGEKVVLRALMRADKIPDLEELGLMGQRLEVVKRASSKTHGMLLVTGPTGSGKSTTLFVTLSQLNKPGVNIVTLEDPVEYLLPGANQGQVNPEIGFSFASGLRSILRQDPNIILVGEIRDKETAELAVHSALTGHIVFSTLHTNDAVGALPRLIDMGIEPFLILASVNAIIAQRLVRQLCDDCKKPTTMTKEALEYVTRELANVPKEELKDIDLKKPVTYKAVGCKKCGEQGYKGRRGIFEAIEVTKEIGELTLQKASPEKLKEAAAQQGMITIRQDGFLKVLRGKTTLEEVLRETGQ